MKQTMLFTSLILLFISCDSGRYPHKFPKLIELEDYQITGPMNRNPGSGHKMILEIEEFPDDLWVRTGTAGGPMFVDAAMDLLLRKLGYFDEWLEVPAGTALFGEGGIMEVKKKRRKSGCIKQCYVTNIMKHDERIRICAEIISVHFIAEEGTIPYGYSGPPIDAVCGDSIRHFLFPICMATQPKTYSITVWLGVRLTAWTKEKGYAQQMIYLDGGVGFTDPEFRKLRYKVSPINY